MIKSVFRNLEVAKDFIQTAVDTTVSTVESAHSAIADAAYSVIEQNAGDNEKLHQLKEKHDATAGQVYQAIRDVNQAIGQMASDFFEAAEDGAHAAKTMAENDERAPK